MVGGDKRVAISTVVVTWLFIVDEVELLGVASVCRAVVGALIDEVAA